MGPMPVKRTGAAAKRQHGPGERHDLSHIIINVIGTMQQAQAALRKVPIGVEIEQQCNDLARRIGVDTAVLTIAQAADGHHRRAIREVEREFFLDRAAQLWSGQCSDKARKGGPAFQAFHWEAAMAGDMREIRHDRFQFVAVYKFLDDDKVERVAAQRLRP